MQINPEFGRRVRELREAKKLTDPSFSLRQFARQVGISATFMSKIETGEFPPPRAERIKRMAELLGVDPFELLRLSGKPDPALLDLVKEQPREVADFLRTARETGLSRTDFTRLTQNLRARKRPR